MRILLDECVPVQVAKALTGHEVTTVQRLGMAGRENGDVLTVAEQRGFDLFVVADKNLRYQQNLAGRRIAILELWTNHRPTLEKHSAQIRAAAETTSPGGYYALGPL